MHCQNIQQVTLVEVQHILSFLWMVLLRRSLVVLTGGAAGLFAVLAVPDHHHGAAAAPAPGSSAADEGVLVLISEYFRLPVRPLTFVVPELHQPLVEILLQWLVVEAAAGCGVAFQVAS